MYYEAIINTGDKSNIWTDDMKKLSLENVTRCLREHEILTDEEYVVELIPIDLGITAVRV